MDDQPTAPPVVAVVVADSPGEWFDQALAGLAAQDYPNASALIMDAGTVPLPIGRVASVLPNAYVRRAGTGRGFPLIANDVLDAVQGASFVLFCHDDVVLEPTSLSMLVDEALRSNAGVVAPKIVEWERPERLLDVGLAVDKTGAWSTIVDRGEIDQEQHDAVRDVFAVSTTCMLVRHDLFQALGGFDPALSTRAAGVDLCWRAQVAGARVVVAPQARVRHQERGTLEQQAEGRDGADSRGHLRSMLKTYSVFHLLRVLPQAALITAVETFLALVTRRWAHARHLVAAWAWNLRRLPGLGPLRRSVRSARTVPDSEVRRLQARGSVRLTRFLHRLRAEERAQALMVASEELVESVWRGPARAAGILLGVLALAIAVGSRDLLFGKLAAVGDLAPLPSPSTLLRHYVGGWRTAGLGSPTAAPPLFAVLGILGGLFLGQMDLLQKVLVLAAWPIAGIGAWRFTRPLRSSLARVVGLVAYLAMPLPYNALARGQWGGLVAYAVAPWLLARLARLSRLEPFSAPEDEESDVPRQALARQVLALGILLALGATFTPALLIAFSLGALGMLLGSLLVGRAGGAARALAVAGAGVGVAAVLLLPWSIELGRPGGWATVTGVARSAEWAPGLGQLLRFQVGPMGSAPLGWTFVVIAALPLVVGRGWRFAWAVRAWGVALACVLVAWSGARGWSPLRFESPDVLLAVAAAALILAAALGAVAFELDLRGYRFGWRQAASVGAGGLLVLATLPVLAAVPNGRWQLPEDESARALAWLPPSPAAGAFRVLWLGDPAVLPLDGWALGGGLAYATSRDGAPTTIELLPGPPAGATRSIADALGVAARGGTARLGRLLAPMAIRFVVLPRQAAPGEPKARRVPPPATLVRALGSQLDLRVIASDASLAVYENEAWGPGRGRLPDEAADDGSTVRAAGTLPRVLGVGADLSSVQPVLNRRRAGNAGSPVRYTGRLAVPGTVLVSESPSEGWRLDAAGRPSTRATALGVTNAFTATTAGPAVLVFRAPIAQRFALALHVGLWIAAVWLCSRLGRAARPGPRLTTGRPW